MSFERRLSGCYVGETVNGVVYLFDLLGQLSTEIIIIPYWTAEQNSWKFLEIHFWFTQLRYDKIREWLAAKSAVSSQLRGYVGFEDRQVGLRIVAAGEWAV